MNAHIARRHSIHAQRAWAAAEHSLIGRDTREIGFFALAGFLTAEAVHNAFLGLVFAHAGPTAAFQELPDELPSSLITLARLLAEGDIASFELNELDTIALLNAVNEVPADRRGITPETMTETAYRSGHAFAGRLVQKVREAVA